MRRALEVFHVNEGVSTTRAVALGGHAHTEVGHDGTRGARVVRRIRADSAVECVTATAADEPVIAGFALEEVIAAHVRGVLAEDVQAHPDVAGPAVLTRKSGMPSACPRPLPGPSPASTRSIRWPRQSRPSLQSGRRLTGTPLPLP